MRKVLWIAWSVIAFVLACIFVPWLRIVVLIEEQVWFRNGPERMAEQLEREIYEWSPLRRAIRGFLSLFCLFFAMVLPLDLGVRALRGHLSLLESLKQVTIVSGALVVATGVGAYLVTVIYFGRSRR